MIHKSSMSQYSSTSACHVSSLYMPCLAGNLYGPAGGFDAASAAVFSIAVAAVAAGLIIYTLGGDPYGWSSGRSKHRTSGDATHGEEMPIMLTLPGSSVLSPAGLMADDGRPSLDLEEPPFHDPAGQSDLSQSQERLGA